MAAGSAFDAENQSLPGADDVPFAHSVDRGRAVQSIPPKDRNGGLFSAMVSGHVAVGYIILPFARWPQLFAENNPLIQSLLPPFPPPRRTGHCMHRSDPLSNECFAEDDIPATVKKQNRNKSTKLCHYQDVAWVGLGIHAASRLL